MAEADDKNRVFNGEGSDRPRYKQSVREHNVLASIYLL